MAKRELLKTVKAMKLMARVMKTRGQQRYAGGPLEIRPYPEWFDFTVDAKK